jgi:hypothetical protein
MKFGVQSFFLPKQQTKSMRWLLLLGFVLLAACSTSGGGDPAKVVADYLTAKVASDEAAMRPLLCSAMEGDLTREASSFAGLGARLENMTCTRDGESNTVTCTGAIVATYGTEESEFPLASYSVVQEDGAWKWCGEAG